MKKVKYLILGAGPAGLTFANYLLKHGEKSFLLLEKEKYAGGLCRTEYVSKEPVDIGGGHILDTRSKSVNEFLFEFMPEERWNKFTRDSQIMFNDKLMGSPFESYIWQLPIEIQIEYLKSIAVAGCNLGKEKPENFVAWIYWKLGNRIAEDYMLPYNQKMFSKNLDLLGTYWLSKLPNVSFEDTLRSCLEKRFYGEQPCHSEFFYPKTGGFGEVFIQMQKALGEKFIGNVDIKSIDFGNKIVNSEYSGEKIIVAMPWTEFKDIASMPEFLKSQIKKLKFSSVQIDYFNKPLPFETTAQWIYYPSLEVSYHRIMVMSNFALGSKGYWTETNSERIKNSDIGCYQYMNKYAYPHNTLEKPIIMKELLEWAEDQDVYGLGRWGEWNHYNADVVIERALDLAERMIKQ